LEGVPWLEVGKALAIYVEGVPIYLFFIVDKKKQLFLASRLQ